ncbi:MAG: GGDEF domain-containing protein, partial [Microthrixaceae bacterium]
AGEALLATGGEVGPGPVSTVELPASSDGTWRVRVSQVAGVGGPSPDTQGLLVFAAGLLISALLFALVRLLSASRDHAMRLVDEKTAELEFLAMHDGLTGLPNRALLLDRATQMLAKQARTSSTAVALFVDLDNFKAVNDTLGHAAGDDYLRTVAGRIENVLRDTDTVGRLGGDEFVVLVEDDETLQRADLIAERIVEVLSEPIEIEDMAVPVSCSIGVAYATDDDAEALIQNADVAMYEAKADGKSRYRVFTREMHDAAADRLTPGSR